ncbi:NAD-dependent epimerase/dehydratase family protein, partial [Acinetobacter baumannii]
VVDLGTLERLEIAPDLLVHCAGSGSVSASLSDPFVDYVRTVDSTVAVLEYVRRHSPHTPVVYPSSAAVYGDAAHLPAKEG